MSAETCYLCGGTALPGWSELRRDSAGTRHGDESVCIHSLGARVAALERRPWVSQGPPHHVCTCATTSVMAGGSIVQCPVHSVPR